MTRSKTWALSVSGLLAVTAIILATYSAPAAADPTVAWSPAATTVLLKPNTSTSTVVRLTATEVVANAQMRVTPSLTKYLMVTPTSVSNLAKGQFVDVTVTLSLPIDAAPISVLGTLQLRTVSTTGAPGSNVSKPLPITINVQCPCLPPDPGEAGMVTLQGIDVDNDGVRDDVQRYIAITFSSSARLQAAATQFAKALQVALTDSYTSAAADAAHEQLIAATDCAIFLDRGDAARLLDRMQVALLNTKVRSDQMDAWSIRYAGRLNLQDAGLPDGSTCSFNFASLPN